MNERIGIVFTTEEFLEDRVHKLVLPETGDAEYSRWAVNVVCQKIPSASFGVAGVEHIAANSDIYTALNFCMGALAVKAANGWTNAFK
jgi:hypothetical protein